MSQEKIELLLNHGFSIAAGKSFFDDFPVWSTHSTAKIKRATVEVNGELCCSGAVRFCRLKWVGQKASSQVAIIGAIVTAENHRSKGYATSVTRQLLDEAKKENCELAILWGSEHALYGRLGFELCGSQMRVELKHLIEPLGDLAILSYQSGYIPSLFYQLSKQRETLGGILLTAKDRQWFDQHKNVRWYWVGEAASPTAWCAVGRGIDMNNMVHEWGGDAETLRRLLFTLNRDHADLQMIGHPQIIDQYRLHFSESISEFLAMACVLQPDVKSKLPQMWAWGLDSA